ncbi:hypothetical protein GOBAR_DD23184 [Gossypium barbadense]|nr:hypothetical protein GOBAR_DD23184 [Gossypium barbadense]
MELVDDEDVETMIALYCEEDGVQEPCMVVLVSYVDSQSTIHGTDIDLNAAPETDVVGDDVYYSSDPVDHEVDSESDPDVDEVPDDIEDEGVNEDGNVNTSLVENQIRGIVNVVPSLPPASALGLVHDADLEGVAQFVSYAEGLPSTAHQTEMVSLSHSTTVCTLTRAADPKHNPSECRDILYATELLEYSIAMIPLHYLKIDNGCANAL